MLTLTIPPMPTSLGVPCPALTFNASLVQLVTLSKILRECPPLIETDRTSGLCYAVEHVVYRDGHDSRLVCQFSDTVGDALDGAGYLGSYFRTDKTHLVPKLELQAIRQAWALHIADAIDTQLKEVCHG